MYVQCQSCGTSNSSKEVCRLCGASLIQPTSNEVEKRKAREILLPDKDEVRADRSITRNHIIRWIIVAPAAVLAFVIPGMIVRILLEDVVPVIAPWLELSPLLFIKGMPQIIQGIVDGVAPVYTSIQVAPNRKKRVGVVTGILIAVLTIGIVVQSFDGYWRDVPVPTVLWNNSLMLLTGISAAISAWYFSSVRQD